jgi:hypothetical protein
MAGPLCLQSLFEAATIDQGTHVWASTDSTSRFSLLRGLATLSLEPMGLKRQTCFHYRFWMCTDNKRVCDGYGRLVRSLPDRAADISGPGQLQYRKEVTRPCKRC